MKEGFQNTPSTESIRRTPEEHEDFKKTLAKIRDQGHEPLVIDELGPRPYQPIQRAVLMEEDKETSAEKARKAREELARLLGKK